MSRRVGDMSVREEFLSRAMQGLCANPNYSEYTYEELAMMAVDIAAATIEKVDRMDGDGGRI